MRRLSIGFVLAVALSAITLSAADTRVADAAAAGNITTVRALIKAGADVNAPQGDGMTALHWAAMKDDAAMAQALVTAGASVKAVTRLGDYTPIFFAAKNGNAAVTRALLAAGADAKVATTLGLTPLMAAAAAGNAETITLLIDKGADVNATEKITSETPLMFAAANNRVDAIKVLVARGADIKAASKIVDIVKEQAAARAAGGGRGGGGAAGGRGGAAAAGRGGAPATPVLIDAATISLVAQSGALSSDVKALQNPGTTAAPGAGRQGQAGQGGQGGGGQAAGDDSTLAPVDFMGGLTPLLFAARQGHMDAVAALVAAGADVNQVNPGDKSSPMLVATVNGKFDIALYLLQHGGNPNLASTANAAPLYAALNVQWAPHAFYPQPSPAQQKTSHLELMDALLKAGAKPNVRLVKKLWYTGYNFDQSGVDAKGTTPFWRATQAGDVPAMKLLIAHGADPSIASIGTAARLPNGRTSADGTTPTPPPPFASATPVPPTAAAAPAEVPGANALMMASGAGYDGNFQVLSPLGFMPALKYLVEELHMDVNVADAKGYTAVHYAAFRGDNEMITYLVSKGADPKVVAKDGMTTVDYANGPVQRLQPFPETIKLLESMGAINNHKCKSC